MSERKPRRGTEAGHPLTFTTPPGSGVWGGAGLIAYLAAWLIWLSGIPANGYWAWAVSIPAYFLVTPLAAGFPSLRHPRASLWTSLVGLLALVLSPLQVLWLGPREGQLPYIPTWQSINTAQLVITVAYVSMSVGVVLSGIGPLSRDEAGHSSLGVKRPPGEISRAMAYSLIAVGYAGGAARLGGPSGGWITLLALLTPLSVLGGFLHWEWARVRDRSWRAVLFLSLVPLASFIENRGALVFSLAALIATYSAVQRTVSGLKVVAAAMLVGYPLIIFWGQARTRAQWSLWGLEYVGASFLDVGSHLGRLVSYSVPAPHVAFAMESAPDRSTLLASLMSPIPAIGEPFRAAAGSVAYNEAVYGVVAGNADQITPAPAEVWWSGGFALLVIFYVLMGCVVGGLERRAGRGPGVAGVYYAHLAALFTSLTLVWSVAIVSQYFVQLVGPPALGLLAVRVMSSRRGRERGATRTGGGAD